MTLPRKIWEDLVVLIEPTQAAASMVLVLVSILTLAVWSFAQRRRGPSPRVLPEQR
jgi:ABC-type spermidine/putrescine transport system permease subunit II